MLKHQIVTIDDDYLKKIKLPHLRCFYFQIIEKPQNTIIKVEVFCHRAFQRNKIYYKKNEFKGMIFNIEEKWLNE